MSVTAKCERPALLVYIEPTSYIAAQVAALRQAWSGPVDTVFIAENQSQAWNIDVERMGGHMLPPRPAAAARALWHRLASRRYAIVHLAGWGHPLLTAALLMARARGAPCVVESDTFREQTSSAWKHLAKAAAYPALFRLPRLFLPGGSRQSEYLARYAVPLARRRIAQMTVDVEAIRAYVAGSDHAPRQRLRQRLGIAPHEVVFLYVGRLDAAKGVGDLLAAFETTHRLNQATRLMLVGDGQLRQEVATRADCGSDVIWLGRLSGRELWDAYAAADTFVLPSHRDGWGLVVNEAMAAGLPVIVSDEVGCKADLVDGRGSGIVVQARDVDALALALGAMASDAGRRLKLAAGASVVIDGWTMRRSAEIITTAWSDVACA